MSRSPTCHFQTYWGGRFRWWAPTLCLDFRNSDVFLYLYILWAHPFLPREWFHFTSNSGPVPELGPSGFCSVSAGATPPVWGVTILERFSDHWNCWRTWLSVSLILYLLVLLLFDGLCCLVGTVVLRTLEQDIGGSNLGGANRWPQCLITERQKWFSAGSD